MVLSHLLDHCQLNERVEIRFLCYLLHFLILGGGSLNLWIIAVTSREWSLVDYEIGGVIRLRWDKVPTTRTVNSILDLHLKDLCSCLEFRTIQLEVSACLVNLTPFGQGCFGKVYSTSRLFVAGRLIKRGRNASIFGLRIPHSVFPLGRCPLKVLI